MGLAQLETRGTEMSEARTPLARRVLEEVGRYERGQAERRSRVVRPVILVGGAIIIASWIGVMLDRQQPAWASERDAAIERTASSDVVERKDAYRQLVGVFLERGDAKSRAAIIDGLADTDLEVKTDLYGVIGRHAAFGANDLDARLIVARMLEYLGGSAGELAVAWGDVESVDWMELLVQLESLSADEQVWGVLFFLESMEPAEAAPYADWALAQLSHPNDWIRARALSTCRKIVPAAPGLPQVVEASLTVGTTDEKVAGMQAMLQLGMTQYIPEIDALLADGDPVVRENALITLHALDHTASLPAIESLVGDGDPLVRMHAAYVLATFGNPSYLGEILSIAQGNAPAGFTRAHLVAEALHFLSFLGDPLAVEIAKGYVQTYPDGVDDFLLMVSINIISQGSEHSVYEPLLTPLLNSTKKHVQVEAAAALHRIGSSLGEPGLVDRMNTPDEEVRIRAVGASKRLRDEKFRKPLEDLLDHQSQPTREAAKRAIDHLDKKKGGSD